MIRLIPWVILPINIFNAYLEKNTNIDVSIMSIVIIGLIFFIELFMKKKYRCPKEIIIGLILTTIITLIHVLLFGFSLQEIKNLSYIYIFAVCLIFYKQGILNDFINSILLISLILSINVYLNIGIVQQQGLSIYNIRQYTIVDKPVFSMIFSLSTVIIIEKIIKGRNKVLFLILLLNNLFIPIVIIQSKLVLVILFFIFFDYFMSLKLHVKFAFTAFILILSSLSILFLNAIGFTFNFLPDYIKAIVNILLSDNIFKIDNKFYDTFIIRATIAFMVLDLFFDNFLWGLGFGGYSKYILSNNSATNVVTETESSFLNMFVEGGFIYSILHIYLLIMIYIYCRRIKKYYKEPYLILITYILLNLANDFMTLSYWIILAAIYVESRIQTRIIND